MSTMSMILGWWLQRHSCAPRLCRVTRVSWVSQRSVAQCDTTPRKGLVLGVYRSEGEEPKLTPTAERFNERVGGRLSEMIKEVADTFKGKSKGKGKGKGKGHTFNNLDPEFYSVCVVEIGKEGAGYDLLENIDEGRENVRVASASGVTRLRKDELGHIAVEDMGYAQEAAEGASLAAWRYQEYKNKEYRKIVPTLELFESCDTDGWTRGLYLADAQNLARRLSEAPSNAMTPTAFAQAAADVLCPCGINVDVRDRVWLEKHHMDLFLHIARGSCESPVLLEINYCGGDPEEKPVLLVGKGTTFDAGGLYLKREGKDLDEHRADMAGAAIVVAIIRAASLLSLPINLCSVLCLCENMPSGMACKPGDIVFSRNGIAVAIRNPDGEGRVCMAEALEYGQKIFKPRIVIDLATARQGIPSLLGDGASAVWSNSRQLWKQVHRAGAISGDRCWKMPLWKVFKDKVVGCESVDAVNEVEILGDPCYQASFLHEFVPCADWLHFDVTGVGMLAHDVAFPYYRYGRMTGRPTRTIIQLLYQLSCPGATLKCNTNISDGDNDNDDNKSTNVSSNKKS